MKFTKTETEPANEFLGTDDVTFTTNVMLHAGHVTIEIVRTDSRYPVVTTGKYDLAKEENIVAEYLAKGFVEVK